PSPIIFPSAGQWDGNDGSWSTFVIRVGSPEQVFRVLPISAIGETFVPIADACNTNDTNCPGQRGVYPFEGFPSRGFQSSNSSTWSSIGLYSANLDTQLGYDVNGMYGHDTLGLGLQSSEGPSLTDQTVAGIVDDNFWMGMIGLNPISSNFSGFDHPQRSFMTSLSDEGRIPSLSYGYTAGSAYRTPRIPGSLILGGYEPLRFQSSNISFPFGPDTRPLALKLQRISAEDTLQGVRSLLDSEIYVQIDFTIPHFWLPQDVCDRFEDAFGLHFDSDTDLYLVNNTMHEELRSKNVAVTITFGYSDDPSGFVNINLPYAAFDLEASHGYRGLKNTTRYFPLRRAANDTQYTLGRVLLQEAYLIVDYEHRNFSIHQAEFPEFGNETLTVPMISPKYALTPRNGTTESGRASQKSSRFTAGIIAGPVIAMLVIFAVSFTIIWKRRHAPRRAVEEDKH
ncbi:aspartic peptidase domain-containing protein, partial [Lophiotrema nucula]